MNNYEITFTLNYADIMHIEAESEEEAIRIFDNTDLDELCNMKELFRSIEIEEIIET